MDRITIISQASIFAMPVAILVFLTGALPIAFVSLFLWMVASPMFIVFADFFVEALAY